MTRRDFFREAAWTLRRSEMSRKRHMLRECSLQADGPVRRSEMPRMWANLSCFVRSFISCTLVANLFRIPICRVLNSKIALASRKFEWLGSGTVERFCVSKMSTNWNVVAQVLIATDIVFCLIEMVILVLSHKLCMRFHSISLVQESGTQLNFHFNV